MACISNIEHELSMRHQYCLDEELNYKLKWPKATAHTLQSQYYKATMQQQHQQQQHQQPQQQQQQQQRLSRHDLFSKAASQQTEREACNENLAKEAASLKPQQSDNNTNILYNSSNNNNKNDKNNTHRRRRRSGTWPRTRSLNAPPPLPQFGPCGRIMKNPAMVMHIQDPAGQRLSWHKPPLTVLVIKKVSDSTVLAPFVQLVDWLVEEKNMVVWVESAVLEEKLLRSDVEFRNAHEKQRHEKFESIRGEFNRVRDKLVTFKDGRDDLTNRIDFIICIGGDGTLLYASQLFQHSVPPVMAFHLGSLGFLTPFRFINFQEQVTNVLEGHAALTLRSRLRCVLQRNEKHKEKTASQQKQTNCDNQNCGEQSTANMNGSTQHAQDSDANSILVLNDVVISRGLSSYLSNVDLFLDGKYITTVQGDGLIVSTPTGSTAYAVAAGASMIHPSVPAIMVTPICPHSLSFRPIVVPAGVELKISVSPDSRNTSWVSFDGRNRQELFHGDSLRVTTSIYPVPSICAQDQVTDWFDSLANGLHWNVRKRQKCLDELSDLTASTSDDTLSDIGNLKM